MKHIFTLLIVTVPFGAICQNQYDWEKSRKLYDHQEGNEESYYLKHYIGYEYIYEGPNKELALYATQHTIIKVNTDEAIESNNKISIPMTDVLDIVDVKARSITPSGEVINLDKSNIKELKDEEQSGYRIFAIEGAEKGGEIEYFFTRKMTPNYFIMHYMQFSSSVRQASFKLTCPENLEFDFRSYNGLENVVQTDSSEEINVYELHVDNVEPITEEEFSAFNASRKRIEAKLAYNSYNGSGRLLTFTEASKRIYDQVYTQDKKEAKAVSSFVNGLSLSGKSEKEQVALLEHHIKSNFYIDNERTGVPTDVEFIVKNKFSSNKGFARLFANSLKALNIPHQLVLTCDRGDTKFDKDFDTWNFLDDYLIYLDNLDEYIAPYNFEFRIGIVPPQMTANYGLFIKDVKIRDFYYPIGEVKYIEPQSYKANMDILDVEVTFPEDLSVSNVKMARSFNGITSTYMKSYLPLMEDVKKKEVVDNIIKYIAPDAEIKDSGVGKTDFSYQKWSEPLFIEGDFTTASYFEMAGNVMLLKIGEMIGEQSELYQEKKRSTQVENEYNRGYLRKLSINLPKGYKIDNPEELVMDFSAEKDGEEIMLFKSNYKIEQDKLVVEIEEFYDEIYWPLENFNTFREVINAAADFNKITLVLKPI